MWLEGCMWKDALKCGVSEKIDQLGHHSIKWEDGWKITLWRALNKLWEVGMLAFS